jgi:two-component system cell cycle response regulator
MTKADDLKIQIPLAPVLVLDDEEQILKSIERELRSTATVESFTSPQTALDALGKKDYSVVIADFRMPEMNGIQFLANCALVRPNTQRILLTAFSDFLTVGETVNKAKIHRLMSKPWEREDLIAAVDFAQRQHDLLHENEQLRTLALTDSLTGVSNRRYFKIRMQSEFSRAQRFKRNLSLIMADVDDFKKFNDEFGHQKGDEILRQVAQSLDSKKRGMDTVARWGGEEFTIILPEVEKSQAAEIAQRHLDFVKSEYAVTLTMGVANFPSDASSAETLIEAADIALRRGKGHGKSQVLMYGDPL